MLTYIGTKTVKAIEMTRGEYNAYRGWEPYEGEDQTVAGYLVEYEPDGKPNHEDHAGYITWSPAHAFDAAYRPANNWQERLIIEGVDLAGKLTALREFMHSPAFKELPREDQNLLGAQAQYMDGYLNVLGKRSARAEFARIEAEGEPGEHPADAPAADVSSEPESGNDPAVDADSAAE